MRVIKEAIEDALAFLDGGPCPRCKWRRSESVGLSDYINLGLRPVIDACPFCICIPPGTPGTYIEDKP